MPALASDLRRQLENVIIQARDVAEAAACAALKRLAVDAARPFDHFPEAQRQWRNRLRARARQAGDQRKPNGEQEIEQLTQELAYEYWHRMLFARFLAGNNLLMHPDGVAVSLADCEDLAQVEGAANGWILAAQYASRMLPQIFRIDDVLLKIEFPINDRLPLEKLLASLPQETFTANDSLGWVYQFWQSKKKDEVNRSGAKIDGRTLPAVTQLFTEPYMVKFLLHNTIGAWWCARHGIKGPSGGAGVPVGARHAMPLPKMEYLRWQDDGTPAAGTFDGWPRTLKEFTMLDPCCGSGHFLVEALRLLVQLRMQDEGSSAKEACDAVLAENLFGLELDPRCTQIAAFALALAAWKYPDESGQPLGFRPLPPLNIACSGQSVTGRKDEWLALANGDSRLLEGMDKLYDLFRQAPHLGSLIDPCREVGNLIAAGFAELQPILEKALAKEKVQQDADAVAVGVAAQGIAKAAELLAQRYALVATNVPYLGRHFHGKPLLNLSNNLYYDGRADLATMFVSRSLGWLAPGSTLALVSPQNWLYQGRYKDFRERFLKDHSWHFLVQLGPGAFETISGEVVKPILWSFSRTASPDACTFAAFDTQDQRLAIDKARKLRAEVEMGHLLLAQSAQLQNPDSRVVFGELSDYSATLGDFAGCYQGLRTGDGMRFIRLFWEIVDRGEAWVYFKGSSDESDGIFGGHSQILLWEQGCGQLAGYAKETRDRLHDMHESGNLSWGKRGVALGQITLRATLYFGEHYDNSLAVVTPRNERDLLPIWTFLSSPAFEADVRRIDRGLYVTNATLLKVPFDLIYWEAIAAKKYHDSLPEPHSDDPTQWLFKGDIPSSTDPLQVTVARLLGYRWPEQPRDKDEDAINALADKDGIVCVPSVRGERPAAERLLDVLRTAYASQWSDAILHTLLTDAGCKAATSLDDWLCDRFFEQHCKRFHHRPFIWHIWDGRKDGFACLVNYHKLSHQRLETLTYAYLQDWTTAQAAAARDGKPGADLRLAAAQELQGKLKLILDGEPPYDIFVRWKPIHEQPIGWNPDLNDGVRVNIRPFVMANVLRKPPNIKWTKDRGNEPERNPEQFPWIWKNGSFTGDRINDVHLTNAQKRTARERVNRGTGG